MADLFPEPERRLLRAIFEIGAESASHSLSQWLGQPIHLTISGVDEVELTDAVGLLGPPEELLAACAMEISGRLAGELLLVFEDRCGLALADMILARPAATATEWGELERSAALETANIVGCSFLNSLAAHLPASGDSSGPAPLLPSTPSFRHEYAAALLEFALMDQAMEADRVLLVRSRFLREGDDLAWWLLFVPRGATLAELAGSLEPAAGS
jgi:chemotaxis protein CheC